MKRSQIAWTDFSGGDLNFVTGCTPVSEGCQHCYARRIYERFGRDHSVVETHPAKLERLAKMPLPQDGNKRGPHSKPMAFVCDTGDMFHEGGVTDWFLFKAFDLMSARTDVTWQGLTKRAVWMCEFMHAYYQKTGRDVLPNLWLGVTAENQQRADERIPLLLNIPAKMRFVSVEPMLGPVNMRDWLVPCRVSCGCDELGLCNGIATCPDYRTNTINWVICGGESGPGHRPMQRAWAEALREQCQQAGVPFFFKQDAGQRPGERPDLLGNIIHEWPETA